jgi:hypothetical protein
MLQKDRGLPLLFSSLLPVRIWGHSLRIHLCLPEGHPGSAVFVFRFLSARYFVSILSSQRTGPTAASFISTLFRAFSSSVLVANNRALFTRI